MLVFSSTALGNRQQADPNAVKTAAELKLKLSQQQAQQRAAFVEMAAVLTESKQAVAAQAREQVCVITRDREREAMQAEDLRVLCAEQQWFVSTCMQTQAARDLREKHVLKLFKECQRAKAACQMQPAAGTPQAKTNLLWADVQDWWEQLQEARQDAQGALAAWHAAELSARCLSQTLRDLKAQLQEEEKRADQQASKAEKYFAKYQDKREQIRRANRSFEGTVDELFAKLGVADELLAKEKEYTKRLEISISDTDSVISRSSSTKRFKRPP